MTIDKIVRDMTNGYATHTGWLLSYLSQKNATAFYSQSASNVQMERIRDYPHYEKMVGVQ